MIKMASLWSDGRMNPRTDPLTDWSVSARLKGRVVSVTLQGSDISTLSAYTLAEGPWADQFSPARILIKMASHRSHGRMKSRTDPVTDRSVLGRALDQSLFSRHILVDDLNGESL